MRERHRLLRVPVCGLVRAGAEHTPGLDLLIQALARSIVPTTDTPR